MELTEPTLTKIIGAIMLSGFIGVTVGGWGVMLVLGSLHSIFPDAIPAVGYGWDVIGIGFGLGVTLGGWSSTVASD